MTVTRHKLSERSIFMEKIDILSLSPETLGRILRNELLPREESASGKRRRPSLPFWKGRGGES